MYASLRFVRYRFSSASGIHESGNEFSLNRIIALKIRKKENSNNIVWFCPERALQKVISKSTVKTIIALANKKQGQIKRSNKNK